MVYRNIDKCAAVFSVIVFAVFLFNGCTVNVNQPKTANNANTGATSSPQKSPTSSPATPEPRRVSVFDEEFSLKPGAIRDVRFTIPKGEKAARLAGGLNRTDGNGLARHKIS